MELWRLKFERDYEVRAQRFCAPDRKQNVKKPRNLCGKKEFTSRHMECKRSILNKFEPLLFNSGFIVNLEP